MFSVAAVCLKLKKINGFSLKIKEYIIINNTTNIRHSPGLLFWAVITDGSVRYRANRCGDGNPRFPPWKKEDRILFRLNDDVNGHVAIVPLPPCPFNTKKSVRFFLLDSGRANGPGDCTSIRSYDVQFLKREFTCVLTGGGYKTEYV